MTFDKVWAVIPAAGVGARMDSSMPKQYLDLDGRKVLELTLERFTLHPRIAGVVVSLADKDNHWGSIKVANGDKVITTTGGAQRCHSVLNGLNYVAAHAGADSWVLVHDAARPCLRSADLDRLLDAAGHEPNGVILAVPVRDTMKRVDEERRITATVERSDLWHALTPQLFRLDALKAAIESALSAGAVVTDEAQAMEMAGVHPGVVEGQRDNIKITEPDDLAQAEDILRLQRQEVTQCA